MKKLIVSTICCYLYVQCASAEPVDANAIATQNQNNQDYQVLEVQYNKNETYYIRQMGVGENGKLAQVTYPWQTGYGQQPYYQQPNHDQASRGQNNASAAETQVSANDSDNRSFNAYRGGGEMRF